MKDRKSRFVLLAVSIVLLAAAPSLFAQQRYPPRTAPYPIAAPQAKYYVGGVATVCGRVGSVQESSRNRGKRVSLNLDNSSFTVVLEGREDRKKGRKRERELKGKKVCATGKIETYGGRPRVVVKESECLALKDK